MTLSTGTSNLKQRLLQGRMGPLILIGLGALLILAGLMIIWLVAGRGSMVAPTSLAGVSRSSQLTGQTALNEIEMLHGKGFPMADGVVAHYGGNAATLWASSAWLPMMAARQVEVMTELIAEGNSPFTPLGTQEVDGTTVYVLNGMGQIHYYFQLDKRVVWLAVSPHLAEKSLEELIFKLQ